MRATKCIRVTRREYFTRLERCMRDAFRCKPIANLIASIFPIILRASRFIILRLTFDDDKARQEISVLLWRR